MKFLLEREDQTDDLRREGNLLVCRDGARAFRGHAGSLGDLGQLGLKKLICYRSTELDPDAADATTGILDEFDYRLNVHI